MIRKILLVVMVLVMAVSVCSAASSGFLEQLERAKAGDAQAQYAVGASYIAGSGVQQDNVAGARWTQLAAEQGNLDAVNLMGYCYNNAVGVEYSLKEAFKYYKIAADKGHGVAQYNVAQCYRIGKGVGKDLKRAFKWAYRSAQACIEGKLLLGTCFLTGVGTKKNERKGFLLAKDAAEQGMIAGGYLLAKCYYNGIGTHKDIIKAAGWALIAKNAGNKNAERFKDFLFTKMDKDQKMQAFAYAKSVCDRLDPESVLFLL